MSSNSRKKRDKNKTGKIILTIVVGLLGLIAVLACITYFYAKSKYQLLDDTKESFNEEDIYVNPELNKKPEETSASDSADTTRAEVQKKTTYTTIMLYGVDTFNNKEIEKYGNADSEIICVINDYTKEVKLVSVLRDTFVETTKGRHDKLTDIYSAYGIKESLGTINKCFDLQIKKYVTVNWRAIAKTIDKLGGIDISLTSKEVDFIISHKDGYSKSSGIPTGDLINRGNATYHLDGIQTLAHVANRSIGHHDISRAERQRQVLSAMLSAAKQCSFEELEDIIDTMLPGISTNIGFSELVYIAMGISDYKIVDTTLFPFKYSDQQDLYTAYVYCKTLTKNVTQLHEYLYDEKDYEPTNTVKKVSDYILKFAKEHP